QDLGALLGRQPGVSARAQRHVIASLFGTIHAATFSLPSPIGTAIPHPPLYALANFAPTDITGSISSQFLGDQNAPLQFPAINRKSKRDSLLARPREPLPPLPPLLSIEPVPPAQADASRADAHPSSADNSSGRRDGSQIYFGADPLAAVREPITPWAPGEAPVVMASVDPDIKQSALAPPQPRGDDKAGETIASTIYFEARGESVRGQIAVAQVVMNRVFSPFYPNDVCGVVYQNSNRHLACQFTFACDGIPDVVPEPDAWARAQRIANDMLGGKLWMPEVAKTTHYHAYWVHPDWVNEMKKIYKLGVHAFYRPRNWGDGSDEPTWGDAKLTEQEAAKEEQAAPVSHSLEWLRSEDGKAFARQSAR